MWVYMYACAMCACLCAHLCTAVSKKNMVIKLHSPWISHRTWSETQFYQASRTHLAPTWSVLKLQACTWGCWDLSFGLQGAQSASYLLSHFTIVSHVIYNSLDSYFHSCLPMKYSISKFPNNKKNTFFFLKTFSLCSQNNYELLLSFLSCVLFLHFLIINSGATSYISTIHFK